ncbi:extracellular solute-binding protein [Photobacterium sp. DNB22_13_2]
MKSTVSRLAVAISLLASGASFASTVETINLYSGGSDNVKSTWDKVIQDFEKSHPTIKVNLEFLPSGTGGMVGADRLIASHKAGRNSGIDLLEVSQSELTNIISQAGVESLAKLDEASIPNLKNVIANNADSHGYSIPYRGTTVVLAYNQEDVKNVPTTSAELVEWIKDNPQRFAYCEPGTGGACDSFLVSSVYNTLPQEAMTSSDDKWSQQWSEGFELLEELHPFMYQTANRVHYPFKNQGALDLLAIGEIDMTPMWADMVLDQKSRGLIPDSIAITQLEPAFTGSLVSLAIPESSDKKAAAKKFVDYVVSSEAQNLFVKEQKAIPVIANAELDSDVVNSLSGLEVSEYRTYTLGNLENQLKRQWANKVAVLNK